MIVQLNKCNIYCCTNACKANVLLLLLCSLVTRKVFAIQHWDCYRTKLRYIELSDAKTGFPKMCSIMSGFSESGNILRVLLYDPQ